MFAMHYICIHFMRLRKIQKEQLRHGFSLPSKHFVLQIAYQILLKHELTPEFDWNTFIERVIIIEL